MTRWMSIVLLSSVLVAIAVSDARAQQTPLFITVVEETPPKATPQQLDGAVSAAQTRMFDLANGVRKQHGDKRTGWPPDAVDAVVTAENTYQLAMAQRYYYPASSRVGLDSIAADLVRELGKSKTVAATPTRDGAVLVIEVIGRRIADTKGVTDARYFIRFRMRPGPATTEARLRDASLPYKWGPDFITKAFVRPTSTMGYWDVEVGSNASYKTAAGIARGQIEGFVRALSAAR